MEHQLLPPQVPGCRVLLLIKLAPIRPAGDLRVSRGGEGAYNIRTTWQMESGRLISSAVPFRGHGGSGGQVLRFGGGFRGGAPMAAAAGAENGRRKRPFLTAHEELQLELGMDVDDFDQLYGFQYEMQGVPLERTKRRLTAEQVQALEVSFEEEKRKLEPERKSELARRLGIAPRQVAVWFQNRRARWRAKQLEQDFDCLRAAHDELLAGCDALVADNDRLRSQVNTLTEKLQAKESPAPQPEEQTATDTTAMEAAVLFVQLDEDQLRETSGSAVPTQGFAGETSSPESYFFSAMRAAPSCSPTPCSSLPWSAAPSMLERISGNGSGTEHWDC